MTLSELKKAIKELEIDNPKLDDDSHVLVNCDSFDRDVDMVSVETWRSHALVLHFFHECQ